MAAPSWEDFIASWQGAIEFDPGILPQKQAEYLNTYGAEGIASMKAAGVALPKTFVDDPELEAVYRANFEEHVAAGRYKPEDWEAFKLQYMGDENTPAQGGTWDGGGGGLTFRPNMMQGSYIDRGNWLTNFTGSLPNFINAAVNPGAVTEALRTSHGVFDVVDTLFDPVFGQSINAGLGSVGAAIKDEPGLQTTVQTLGPTIGGVVGSIVPVIGTGVGAAVGKGVAGKILGEDNEKNFTGALQSYIAGQALAGLGDAVGSNLNLANLDPDAAAIIADMADNAGYNAAVASGNVAGAVAPGVLAGYGPGGMDYGLPITAPGDIASAATGSGVIDTIKSAAGDVLDVANLAGGISNAFGPGADQGTLPPLPSLLETQTPGEALPPLPDRIALAMPEGLTFPDIAPYLPKNWDSMSEAEREAWLITRGGEISKRRKGTWAGNLEGIRGGKGAGLEYAELVGMTGGKDILGA